MLKPLEVRSGNVKLESKAEPVRFCNLVIIELFGIYYLETE